MVPVSRSGRDDVDGNGKGDNNGHIYTTFSISIKVAFSKYYYHHNCRIEEKSQPGFATKSSLPCVLTTSSELVCVCCLKEQIKKQKLICE